MSYNIKETSFFESSANDFINSELDFPNTQFINKTIDYKKQQDRSFFIGRNYPRK